MSARDTRAEAAAGHRYLLLALAGILPFFVNGPINAITAAQPVLYWSIELLIWIAIPVSILLLAARTPGFRMADLGFHRGILQRHSFAAVTVASLLFAPLCYLLYLGIYNLFERWFPGGGFFEYESVIPAQGLTRYLVIAYFALSAGFVEEFLYRGLLFRAALAFRHPARLFVIVSPLLFSLVHWESGLANLCATYVFGLFMAGVFLWLRNLWPLIAGHVLTDLLWFA